MCIKIMSLKIQFRTAKFIKKTLEIKEVIRKNVSKKKAFICPNILKYQKTNELAVLSGS